MSGPDLVTIDRRAFLGSLALSVLAAPLMAEAQPGGKVSRVGILAPGTGPLAHFEAFRDLGYVEGQSVILEPRWEEEKPERYAAFAEELARLNVDVVVAGTTPA